MPADRKPGPTCGHLHGSKGVNSHRSASAHHGGATPPVQARVISVSVDPQTLKKEVAFDRAITGAEASMILFHDSQHAGVLAPTGGHLSSRSFQLLTRDIGTIMSLRADVRDAIIQGSVLRSNAKPWDFPAWVPQNVRDDITSGKLPAGVTRYPTSGDWGDIVVWKGNATVQLYWEFPDSMDFYVRLCGDESKARLVHYAYTQYNKDMRHFVDEKGMSPEDAKSELRRINEEVFKLIIEGAVAMLSSGVGIAQVNNTIRANADRMASATRRSARIAETELESSPALARLQKSQRNLQNMKVERTSYVLKKPTSFRHSLFKADIPAATYNQIKRSGKLLISTGGGAHYGEGVYVYAVGKEVPSFIDIEVPAGVAVEELQVEGQGTFYRLVPAAGNGVPVNIQGTDISKEMIDTFEKLLSGTE